ncbi:uncharacterized protein LOC120675870 [Panicum virgatum]|uniref:uncharacterized protein LOC120675870 n=1 Tax=Panicum virgatum TaxID=38727 RepID=UPI0019D60BC2|nr:uncharacterized protein LOC120675870 [Panicum virgatum]
MDPCPAPPRVGPVLRKLFGPSWLVLDRFIHRSDQDLEDEGDGTASETSYTCTNRPIRVSLRVADSPAVSRLYLHWPGRPEFRGLPEPRVIAAHDHSILFMAIVPFEDPMYQCAARTPTCSPSTCSSTRPSRRHRRFIDFALVSPVASAPQMRISTSSRTVVGSREPCWMKRSASCAMEAKASSRWSISPTLAQRASSACFTTMLLPLARRRTLKQTG